MGNNPKNFSVKVIKGHAYIYSWIYKKKNHRSTPTSQRYRWKYRGRYGTKRLQSFVKRLNEDERKKLDYDVNRKLEAYETVQKQIEKLLKQEPFKTHYNEISNLKNRVVREQKLKQLHRELTRIVKNGQRKNS